MKRESKKPGKVLRCSPNKWKQQQQIYKFGVLIENDKLIKVRTNKIESRLEPNYENNIDIKNKKNIFIKNKK